MSSLAAARADNFYYPPEYRREHGSLNKFRGSHPLGDRAKKIKEGILVIRFEMPYKVFCSECHQVIAKGVRFNAEKKCVGMYFSTKILEFSMRCCFCPNIFRIQTDPKDCEYKIMGGLHKKVETYSSEDAQTLEFRSAEERVMIEQDPMLKLETVTEDQRKQVKVVNELEALLELQDEKGAADHDYRHNAELRRRFRLRKAKELREQEEETTNFVIPLLPSDPSDEMEAKSVAYKRPHYDSHIQRRLRAVKMESSSVFTSQSCSVSAGVSQRAKKQKCCVEKESTTSRTSGKKQNTELEEKHVLVPAGHPAVSLIVRAPKVVPAVPAEQESSQQRRSRLHQHLEKLRLFQRRAQKNPILQAGSTSFHRSFVK